MIKRSCKSIEKSLDMFVYVNLLINYIFSSEKKNECTIIRKGKGDRT